MPKLRAMVCYPMTNGRSVDKIHRLIVAPQTCDAADARMNEGLDTVDRYFATKTL